MAKNSKSLFHYGVKGMHWGVRRYQNYDGTLIGSRPKTAREKLLETQRKKVAKGDPTTNAVIKLIGSGNSKVGKKIEQDYNKTIEKNNQKLENKQQELKKKEDAKYAKEVAEKNPIYYKSKTYTDKELQEKINRLRLEEQFREMAIKDMKAGENYVTYKKGHDEKSFDELLSEDVERDIRREMGKEISRSILEMMAMGAAA